MQSWVVIRETACPLRSKIFFTWTFKEKKKSLISILNQEQAVFSGCVLRSLSHSFPVMGGKKKKKQKLTGSGVRKPFKIHSNGQDRLEMVLVTPGDSKACAADRFCCVSGSTKRLRWLVCRTWTVREERRCWVISATELKVLLSTPFASSFAPGQWLFAKQSGFVSVTTEISRFAFQSHSNSQLLVSQAFCLYNFTT